MVPKDDMRPYLPEDPVIVEAGAHAGVDTVELAETWPSGRVYAFEPVPSLFRQLEARIQGLPNVDALELGLARGDRQGAHPPERRQV